MAKIWIWISSLFPKSKIGILFSMLFAKATSVVVSDLLDTENQRKAYEFVKDLHRRTDMSNREKAETFNLMMLAWAKDEGKKIAESVINCLRELAVNALKTELQKVAEQKTE